MGKLKKNDWRKRLIGYLIKRQTSVALRWIGENLVMGNDSHVSRLCGRIDDLANQADISRCLTEIEARVTRIKTWACIVSSDSELGSIPLV